MNEIDFHSYNSYPRKLFMKISNITKTSLQSFIQKPRSVKDSDKWMLLLEDFGVDVSYKNKNKQMRKHTNKIIV